MALFLLKNNFAKSRSTLQTDSNTNWATQAFEELAKDVKTCEKLRVIKGLKR